MRDAARRHGALVGADATIATPHNWRPLDAGLDFVVHSTSKFLSGRYDHLGGLVVTTSAELAALLRRTRDALDLAMPRNQMRILHANLKGFPARMDAINRGAAEIVARLKASPAVARVNYPGSASAAQERAAAAILPRGRSGLLSFTLRDGSRAALERAYDAAGLPVRKGLGLGGETSLLCPYVMVAHPKDDDALLAARGLDRGLLRLSVGTEPVDEIWKGLDLP
jgi:cystathionine beta-lyase/cystathionine gamma-synthase